MLQDIRYALRQLRRTPAFTIVAILTLALGIGANTAIFSVMNAVLLRYLPVRDPQQLVFLNVTRTPNNSFQTGHGARSLTYPIFEALRKQKDAFADVVAYVPLGINKVPVRFGKEPDEANADMVSGNFFSGLGVRTILGRPFALEDETAHSPVAVISYGWWTSRFGRDASVIGKPLYIKDVPFTVIGVTAPDFIGVERQQGTDLWIPFQDNPDLRPWGRSRTDTGLYDSPRWWFLMMMGRLAPGVSEQQALARANPVMQAVAYADRKPDPKEEMVQITFTSAKGVEGAREDYNLPLQVLMAMVLLVLVIACANVSLLLVARNAVRQREFSLRMALGGSRLNLFQQLLTESLMLVVSGAALGWLFARWSTGALSAWSDFDVSLTPDRTVLFFTLAVSMVAGLVFGLAPLRSAVRVPIGLALKTSAATAHRDSRRIRGSQVVIALQMSLCMVLLVTAGLLVRTLQNLQSVNLGMKTDGLLVFGISPLQRVHNNSEANRFYQGLITRLRTIPGVQGVTVMSNRIGSGWSNNASATVDGKPALGEKPAPLRWNVAGPDYFRTVGTPVLLGRDFNDSDSETGPRATIVNQTFADHYLAGRSPLGHVVNLGSGPEGEYTIVGVVADSKYTGVRETARPMAYFPYTQRRGNATLHFEVRTAGDPATWLPTVRRVANEYAPGLALLQPMTQSSQFERTYSQERLFFRLSMFFGLLAALLVATGLYATLAYTVSRRTAEVGLRMALGAQRGQVLWMVLRGSLVVTAIGVAVGLPMAIAATKLVRSVLFGVTPGDPLTFVAALIGIGVIALTASLLPAIRAASVDPLVALRYE